LCSYELLFCCRLSRTRPCDDSCFDSLTSFLICCTLLLPSSWFFYAENTACLPAFSSGAGECFNFMSYGFLAAACCLRWKADWTLEPVMAEFTISGCEGCFENIVPLESDLIWVPSTQGTTVGMCESIVRFCFFLPYCPFIDSFEFMPRRCIDWYFWFLLAWYAELTLLRIRSGWWGLRDSWFWLRDWKIACFRWRCSLGKIDCWIQEANEGIRSWFKVLKDEKWFCSLNCWLSLRLCSIRLWDRIIGGCTCWGLLSFYSILIWLPP